MIEYRQFATLPDGLREAITAGATRTFCPTCKGGTTSEQSLSVRPAEHVDGLLKLSCWRASCGWYCVVITGTDVVIKRNAMRQARPFGEPTTSLPLNLRGTLYADYGVSFPVYNAHGWRVSGNGVLVMSVLSPYGQVRGHITRTFGKPKRVYTYKTTAQPWLDWWPGDGGYPGIIVIVEDCLSACRLAGIGYCAVALLGTGINVAQAKEIAELSRGGTVYLALDRDAYVKSLKLAARFAHVVKLLPVCLDQDVKNIEDDRDIDRLFGGGAHG